MVVYHIFCQIARVLRAVREFIYPVGAVINCPYPQRHSPTVGVGDPDDPSPTKTFSNRRGELCSPVNHPPSFRATSRDLIHQPTPTFNKKPKKGHPFGCPFNFRNLLLGICLDKSVEDNCNLCTSCIVLGI